MVQGCLVSSSLMAGWNLLLHAIGSVWWMTWTGNRFTWNISTHPPNRAKARLLGSALWAIFTIGRAKGIRMNRLDDITLGELMTLSPKTKEVQITADIHTHWYIRKGRSIYTTPVEPAISKIWSETGQDVCHDEEEVLTHIHGSTFTPLTFSLLPTRACSKRMTPFAIL